MRTLVPFFAGALLASCTTYSESVPIHFSTQPPGADVVVDGVPTGFATPCMVALEKRRQIVTFEKTGYQVPARILEPDPYNDTWYWSEATVGPHTFDFPILINLDDFLQPVVARNELIAARIHVRLKREADQALGAR